ncbi:unnamed protein product [Mytilus coruscus]|uniref:B box-type domain-containing protein n=1 Tax=Mytilus coruscus TaxID=42192 RepID=A0A6J8CQD1_MYTCO|nr:unnamed protein product [Mytilus coruscus]
MISTLKHAQTVQVCEFCETERKLIGKCLDCSLLLCSKCSKNLHLKLQQAADHKIVELKDLSKQLRQDVPKMKLKSTSCKMHNSQTYCLYCKTCEELVCPTCIPSHQNHKLRGIDLIFQEKINDIENLNKELKISLSQKVENLKEARRIKEANFHEVKDEIKKEEDRLIVQLKNKTNIELNGLEKKWRLDDKALSEEETSINLNLTELSDSLKSIQSEIEKGETANIASLINTTEASQKLRLSECTEPVIQLLDFIPGNVDLTKITSKILGTFTSYTLIKSFQLPIYPFRMAHANNGNVWISDGSQLVEYNASDKMETLRSIECNCCELGHSTESNGILFLTEHEINKLNEFGTMKKIYDFAPYKSTTFHVSKEKELTVTLELQETKQSNKRYPSKIVVLTMSGKIKQEYNFSEPVIVDCNSIIKTSDGLFCFTSQVARDNTFRKVKMMNKSRNIIWEYPLNLSKETTTDNFIPVQLTESRQGNIIMTERTSSALHILDKAGQILKVVSTVQFGIQRPSRIACDCNGNLWIIGKCSNSENSILCVLEIIGF